MQHEDMLGSWEPRAKTNFIDVYYDKEEEEAPAARSFGAVPYPQVMSVKPPNNLQTTSTSCS